MKRLLVMTLALFAGAAQAQYTNPYNYSSWNNPVSASIDLMISQRIQRQMLERSIAQKYGAVPKTEPAAAAPAALPKVAKQPIAKTDLKAWTKGAVADQLGASVTGVSDAEKKQLVEVVKITVGAIEGEKDFRKNNLAYALGTLIGLSLQVASEKEIPDADALALIDGINEVLATDPSFQKMPLKTRQQLYEGCLVTAGLMAGIYQAGVEGNDPDLKKQAQQMAKSTLAQFGFEI